MRTSRWPISHLPISDITPFTHRDGETYLELLNRLTQYITEQLHPNLRKTVEHMVEEVEHILAAQHGKYVEGIQDFQRIHDAFMTDVNSALMALNDNAVADLADDPGSVFGKTLRELFSSIGITQSRSVNVGLPPYNIKDGEDVSSRINEAIQYVSTLGGGTVVVPYGDYVLDPYEHLEMESGVDLSIDPRATLTVTPNDLVEHSAIRVNNKENVRITGGKIIGERHEHVGSGGWGMGVEIRGSHNVVVESVEIVDFWNDAVYIGRNLLNSEPSKNIHVTACRFDGNRRQGISVVCAEDVFITDNVITNTQGVGPGAGIDVEPNVGDRAENVYITGNTFTGNFFGVLVYGVAGPISGVIVSGNNIAHTERTGVRLVDTDEVRVIGNTIGHSGFRGIHVVDSNNNIIDANNITKSGIDSTGTYPAIGFSGSSRNAVSNNIVKDSAHNGILISGSSKNTVSSNIVTDSSNVGVLIAGSSEDNIITANHIASTGSHGIQIFGESQSSGHVFSLNVLSDIGDFGVSILGSDSVYVTQNTFQDVFNRHVNINTAEKPVVSGNIFRSTTVSVGVLVPNSVVDAMVVGNDFIDSVGVHIQDYGERTITEFVNRT